MKKILICISLILIYFACAEPEKPLIPLGNVDYVERTENGQTLIDTVYHTVPDFSFLNQDGKTITQADFENKVYVSDFFFTHCPTICPTVKAQMLRIYNTYKGDDRFLMVSHTIDPVRDSVAVLKKYATKLQIETDKWYLLTGNKAELYETAHQHFVPAAEDKDAPGGFTHGGHIVLVDTKKRVRTYCDGTDPKDVDRLIKDIKRLMNEEFK